MATIIRAPGGYQAELDNHSIWSSDTQELADWLNAMTPSVLRFGGYIPQDKLALAQNAAKRANGEIVSVDLVEFKGDLLY